MITNYKEIHDDIITLVPVKRFSFKSARLIGLSFIFIASIGVVNLLRSSVYQEAKYALSPKREVQAQESLPTPTNAPVLKKSHEAVYEAGQLGINPLYSIYIPKIDAKADVVAEIDTQNENLYLDALQKGVAHAMGTSHPGQGDTIYMFAHSTDSPLRVSEYNAVFYLLRKLEAGDSIIVYHNNEKYVYKVSQKIVVEASDTSWLTKTGQEKLILQTCDPPGTQLKRLLIIAEPNS